MEVGVTWWLLLVASLLCLALLLHLVKALRRWLRVWHCLREIGGPFGALPVFFNVILHKNFGNYMPHVDYTVSLFNMFVGFTKVFKNQYVYYIGFNPFVMIYSPEGMEALLSHQENLNKAVTYDLLLYWLGEGLLTSKRAKWKGRRKMLTPAFHFRILEDILPVVNKESDVLIEKIGKLSKHGPVSIISLLQLCTLNIICETAMGVDMQAQQDEDSPYVRAVVEIGESFMYRMMNPHLWSNFFFHYLTLYGWKIRKHVNLMRTFALNVIEKRKEVLLSKRRDKQSPKDPEEFSTGYRNRKSFIDILLELHLDDSNFTLNDIREEVDTFMFEGHDTTSVGIGFALYVIGLYKEIQDKLYQELQSILGNEEDRTITAEDLKEMKYMECVLKESQRVYPSVPFIGRMTDEDFYIRNHLIPRGCNASIFIYGLHHNADVFPDPEKFDPDRFRPENCQKRSPYAFIPFSAGSRSCIGQKFALMEEKIIVANILRKFEIISLEPRDKINLVAEMVLRPKSNLKLKFIPRR